MPHDVFISHATNDKPVADAVCAALESNAIRCWIAPRDVQPGRSFAGEITRAIQTSKAMVLVFSAHSNSSDQVLREVQLAVSAHLHIVQFRIEDVMLNDDLSYFLGTPHWLDALTPPLENHLERLAKSMKALIALFLDETGKKREASSVKDRAHNQTVQIMDKPLKVRLTQSKRLSVIALTTLVIAGAFCGWWFGVVQPNPKEEKQRQMTEKHHLESEARMTAVAEANKERQRAQEEQAKKKEEDSHKNLAVATKEQPYENSLQMKFVPVPRTSVYFSTWETRVRDFRAFAAATGYQQKGGLWTFRTGKLKDGSVVPQWGENEGASWEKLPFKQTEEHPVTGVSWEEAKEFCTWLTGKERKEGKIGPNQEYRLPTDDEWSAAVGGDKFPWGNEWPPPGKVGNYLDQATMRWLKTTDPAYVPGDDGYRQTAPVGSFVPNRHGLYDLGGNIWELCEDRYRVSMNSEEVKKKFRSLRNEDRHGQIARVVRGGHWLVGDPTWLQSDFRYAFPSVGRIDYLGFRCVLVADSPR